MNTPILQHLFEQAESLRREGKPAEAAQAYGKCLTLDPLCYAACRNLGHVLREMGRLPDAIRAYERGLSMQPKDAAALRGLGDALRTLGQYDKAIVVYRRALELWPHSAEFHQNLGLALCLSENTDQAVEALERAVQLEPQRYLAHNNLAYAYESLGDFERAIAHYDRALEIAPHQTSVAGNRLFALQCKPDLEPSILRAELEAWDRRFARPLRESIPPLANDRSADRPLRIGYVSADFRRHVVGWNLLPILTHHDRRRFNVFCYSNLPRPDDVTEQLAKQTDGWRNIVSVSDDQAAQMIRADKIDILVDLALHSAGNRLLIFARKPAPVQITYLGYAGTTGLPTIDYRLSDPWLDPPDADPACYTEKTLRLPHSYWCYQSSGPTPDVRPAPRIANGYVTFGCLTNFAKVSRAALQLWTGILQRMPASHLLLYCPSLSRRQTVSDLFAARGIPPERVEFVAWQPWDQYIQTYHRMDIALDPFPRGGGITSCDAIWMGVPVITLMGKTAMGRGGCSVLGNVGLSELIAHTETEYVALAAQAERWIELRPTLRERMRASPLMDPAGFCRDLEGVYHQVWATWAAQ